MTTTERVDRPVDGRRRADERVLTPRRPRTGRWHDLAADTLMHLLLAVSATVAAWGFLGLFSRPLDIPLVYDGDALSGGAQVKGVIENGWYERNPQLGAPFGINLHDFPIADNMQFVWARLLSVFSDQYAVVYNLSYVLTFPAAALAAAWFLRVVGVRRSVAFTFGMLLAFTPYHFIHGQPHLALSMLFVVPLLAALIVKLMADRPVWGRRGGGRWWNPLSWATGTTVGTLLVLAVAGSTSSYYAVFGLILLSVATVVLLVRRRWVGAAASVTVMLGLIAVMLANMLPDLLYARSVAPSAAAFARQPLESEIYALKLTALLLPAPWHRIDAWSRFRLDYDGTFPLPSESPTLGLVAAIGFVFLVCLPFALALRRPGSVDTVEEAVAGRTQRHLSLLAAVCFLFGTIGGLGTMFALFVSSDIRAWNRIVVYIALFGLASVALLVDHALTRWRRRAPSRRVGGTVTAVVVCLALLGVGLYDEAAPPTWTSAKGDEIDRWRNDETYVRAVEATVPTGTAVFELPPMVYPESLPINEMHDYDPVRPYLHSRGLSWSYGGVKGRPKSDWGQVVVAQRPVRMAVALAASGFGGIHLDRYGYPGRDAGSVEQKLTELAGPPVESPDDRFAFFDLTGLQAEVEQDYSPAELASIRRHTLETPIFYWQPGFNPPTPDSTGSLLLAGTSAAPTAVIDNPAGPIPMKLTFEVVANGATSYPADVDVTWPDGVREQVSVDSDGTTVSHRFRAARGQSTLALAGRDMTSINLVDMVLRDPEAVFPLRGRAGEIAGDSTGDTDGGTGTGTGSRSGGSGGSDRSGGSGDGSGDAAAARTASR